MHYTRDQIKQLARDYLSGENNELEYTFAGFEADIEIRDRRIGELETFIKERQRNIDRLIDLINK